jgi:hypothetical protein
MLRCKGLRSDSQTTVDQRQKTLLKMVEERKNPKKKTKAVPVPPPIPEPDSPKIKLGGGKIANKIAAFFELPNPPTGQSTFITNESESPALML